MLSHPAHVVALGFGSGLVPLAPGTAGTLWAWVAFSLMDVWFDPSELLGAFFFALFLGIWACTRTAQHLGVSDPAEVVWDEVVGFWLVLWVLLPFSTWIHVLAFALFRLFDALKRGPVGWADRHFKNSQESVIGWRQGFGIIFDDLVAALLTLLTLAVIFALWQSIVAEILRMM